MADMREKLNAIAERVASIPWIEYETRAELNAIEEDLRALAAQPAPAGEVALPEPYTRDEKFGFPYWGEKQLRAYGDARAAAAASRPATAVPEGWILAPIIPTEEQWGGLARSIVMWARFDRSTGAALFRHLDASGVDVPDWLRDEVDDTEHVPPKGTVAAIIYRAMLSAAPQPAAVDHPPVRKASCNMGVGCEEMGVCYAEANGHPERCGKPNAHAELLQAIDMIDDFIARCEGNDSGSDHAINGIRDYINHAFATPHPQGEENGHE